MNTRNLTISGKVFVALTAAEGHVLYRIDNNTYLERRATVPSEAISLYEEVSESEVPRYTEDEYNKKVAELIHERYDADQETALINNMLEAAPTEKHCTEYAEYQAYRAECKERAKDPALYNPAAEPMADSENE